MLNRIMSKLKSPFAKDPMVVLQERIFSEVTRALSNGGSNFPLDIKLPQVFGKELPERVIEVYLAALSYKPGLRVLDVGHANAMLCHLKMINSLTEPVNITGIDIAEPMYDTLPFYQQSLVGDITDTPFTDGTFDLIWCISALEHFGMDNSGYTGDFTRDNAMDTRAMKEMLRVLAFGGGLLVSVPYGKYEDHGWFRNYDQEHLESLMSVAKSIGETIVWYFKYKDGQGWSIVSPKELKNIGYYNESNPGAAGLAIIYTKKNG